MATDTLEIFGTEYSGVTGIKATDNNGNTKTYIRPQGTMSISANGTGIDVTAYAAVDVAVSGGGGGNYQSKSTNYTPSETAQSETITADSGYDALSSVSVSVGAISTTYVGSGVTRQAAQTIYPSTSDQSIASGRYLTGAQTIKGVQIANLTAGNIKSGVTITVGDSADADRITSVTGTYTGGSSMNVQAWLGRASRTANSYGALSGATLTVAKTGTYTVSWTMWRSSSSGTMGTNLHVNDTTGTNQQTFTGTYGQNVELTGQHYNADDVLTLYATSGATNRTIYVANLVIVQTA